MTEEQSRDDLTNYLRAAIGEWFKDADESLLINAVIVSEWATPDGNRVLTRNTVGTPAEWTVQGMLWNALHDVGFFVPDEDEDPENDEGPEAE